MVIISMDLTNRVPKLRNGGETEWEKYNALKIFHVKNVVK
jgi:hypothetical protein